ncbi:MAG: hypothetical protein LBP75_09830 [Planctomycetota bacterium]|nr:hypothetical protein [Planctomycetota bacterium]
MISQLSEKCRQLKLIAADGKAYKTDAKRGSRYGYRLEYEGNAPDGTPYAKTASVLNSGTSTIKPRRFITKAVRKLKGLDDRAAKRWEEKINDEFTE